MRVLICGLLLCAGCLVQHDQQQESTLSDPFISAASPIVDSRSSADPSASTPVSESGSVAATEQPATAPKAYTGAVVYGNTETCEACRKLAHDLWQLRERGWTVGARGSPVFTGTEDWILSLPLERHEETPIVEYYVAGRRVGVHTGYSTAELFEHRTDALAVIVHQHPASAVAQQKGD